MSWPSRTLSRTKRAIRMYVRPANHAARAIWPRIRRWSLPTRSRTACSRTIPAPIERVSGRLVDAYQAMATTITITTPTARTSRVASLNPKVAIASMDRLLGCSVGGSRGTYMVGPRDPPPATGSRTAPQRLHGGAVANHEGHVTVTAEHPIDDLDREALATRMEAWTCRLRG